MLCLSRRVGEKLVCYTDEGVKVTIVLRWVSGNQAGFGIIAAPDVHIDREEVYLRKHPEAAVEVSKS